MKLNSGLIFVLAFFGLFTACGGPTDVQFNSMGLKVQLPSGWKADAEEAATKYSSARVELRKNDKRTLIVSKYTMKVDNFEAMEKALSSMKDVKILDKEEFDTGFGFTYEKKGKPLFSYFITFGDDTFECKPNDFYYDPKDIPAAIEVIKTIRKI